MGDESDIVGNSSHEDSFPSFKQIGGHSTQNSPNNASVDSFQLTVSKSGDESSCIIEDSYFETALDNSLNQPQEKTTLKVSDGIPKVESKNPEQKSPVARKWRQSQLISPASDTESSEGEEENEILEISSDDEEPVLLPINYVSPSTYAEQKNKITKLEFELMRAQNTLKTVATSSLPDGGQLLKAKHASLVDAIKTEEERLRNMVVDPKLQPAPFRSCPVEPRPINWDKLRDATAAVQPNTFGKQALQTLNTQKALTLDMLEGIHTSLKTRPDENTFETDPKGLKVELMPHQKRAIAWLLWREKVKPSGGILADDMGLGKTLTMISLLLKTKEKEEEEVENRLDKKSGKYLGGTLVVCPASLLNQWEGEVHKRLRRGLIDVEVYHGAKREEKPKRLAKRDMVITTYSIVQNEREGRGTLLGIKWRRIILDEAHQIRNYKSRTAEAVFELSAKSRWALTGTPIHNKEEDLFSLLKFLRCSPFDDLAVWKRWVKDKSNFGQERLNTVISSLLLRRTKEELHIVGALQGLPERKWELIPVHLKEKEMNIYQKVLVFSRTLFAQFLHQRAERNQGADVFSTGNDEYYKMHQKLVKLNRVKEIKQHEILVLLLRLRQICCHPHLITAMLESKELDSDSESVGEDELNILEQLNNLTLLDDHESHVADGLHNQQEAVALSEATKDLLNPSNPIFLQSHVSSKISTIIKILKERILPTKDKVIVVSQWTSLLSLVAFHLKEKSIEYSELNGSIPVHKRMTIVDNFNSESTSVKVLLLSLTAGGVGLNLVGANHLILVDLHWNPQLEMQAQDRIYRLGQTKTVHVYKLMAVDTIEERIKTLQEKKIDLAESVLTGSKMQSSKLTIQDLKLIFNM